MLKNVFSKSELKNHSLPITVISVLVLWLLSWIIALLFIDFERLSVFLNIINTFFVALFVAVISIVLTLLLKERKWYHTIVENQQAFLRSQETRLNQYNEEVYLFRLIDAHRQFVQQMEISTNGDNFTGQDAIAAIFNAFVKLYDDQKNEDEPDPHGNLFKQTIQRIYDYYSAPLSVYFHQLLLILMQIDAQSSEKIKNRFATLIQASLSNAELLLIFYYCTNNQLPEAQQLRSLIKKLNTLEYLPEDMVEQFHLNIFNAL
ncbi:MAG: hypothetical protein GF313_14545 [Caldithrix sp.]|nr:hypothetical protein [Caldithrix sp.]